jgi:hypothetical protein
MSVEMLDRVYGHHHPDHLRAAARALGVWSAAAVIGLNIGRTPRAPSAFTATH